MPVVADGERARRDPEGEPVEWWRPPSERRRPLSRLRADGSGASERAGRVPTPALPSLRPLAWTHRAGTPARFILDSGKPETGIGPAFKSRRSAAAVSLGGVSPEPGRFLPLRETTESGAPFRIVVASFIRSFSLSRGRTPGARGASIEKPRTELFGWRGPRLACRRRPLRNPSHQCLCPENLAFEPARKAPGKSCRHARLRDRPEEQHILAWGLSGPHPHSVAPLSLGERP